MALEDLQQAVELVGQIGAALAVARPASPSRCSIPISRSLQPDPDAVSSALRGPVGSRVRPAVRSKSMNVVP
jgi:hypothetical protein